MKIIIAALASAGVLFSSGEVKSAQYSTQDDPYLWLEEIQSESALNWVKGQNARSLGAVQADPRYVPLESRIREILTATDRIPEPEFLGEHVYNFWQDPEHVRGIWRRTTLQEYKKPAPAWERILDVDLLAESESENWVWKGATCLDSEKDGRCLISLSRGGKDAVVVREFDLRTRSFIEGGFVVPEAKSSVTWVDENTLLVGTELGSDSMTTSGYPRQMRLWKRGTPLESSKLIYTAEREDMGVWSMRIRRPEGNVVAIQKYMTFYTSRTYLLKPDQTLLELPIPTDASMLDIFKERVLVQLKTDWAHSGHTYPAGALVALRQRDPYARPELIFAPDERSSIEGVSVSQDHLLVKVLENVRGRILSFKADPGGIWTPTHVSLPDHGSLGAIASSSFHRDWLVTYENFITPTTQYLGREDGTAEKIETLRQLPARFDSTGLVVEQLQSTSKDGTRIPYFLVRRADLPLDGSTPTLQYGYGGFEISLTPYYVGSIGRGWLEKGGAFVIANIRGGGEFGPKWHQAALKKNRQRAFDDFISVAEDLIARKITSPRRLGIMGGSNGGLLVGAMLTQRPDLFNAVVCQVPLLDMLRYHKLLAGFSWVGEYGNPDDPEMAEVIRAYSPYQNLHADRKYPKVFFLTSTLDDRVHPGHARKMAARMEEMGHEFLYFENTEGGHGAAANLEQKVKRTTLELVYLYQQLFD